MPEWRERLQKKLSDKAEPVAKFHFDWTSRPNILDPLFQDVIKVIAKMRGCKTIVTEECATFDELKPSSEFSRLLLHDRPSDLEQVKLPKKKKGKKKKKDEKDDKTSDKKAAAKPKAKAKSAKPTQKYQCWVLE
jgi:hypothetical protein